MPEHTPAPTPSRAVYGFVLHLSFKMFFIIYLMWAMLPESFFVSLGITCLPQRYWAIAVPIFILTVLATFAFIIYPSLNLCMTPGISDLRTISDQDLAGQKHAIVNDFFKLANDCSDNYCSCKDVSKCSKKEFDDNNTSDTFNNRVPLVRDLDMVDVSKHLYLYD